MRILQINSARSIGGGERHVIDLSDELTARGHEVFVAVVPGSPVRAAFRNVPAENIVDVPLRNALDVGSIARIASLARGKKIDLMNVHFAKDYPVVSAAATISKVPYVITRHVLFPMNSAHRMFLRNTRYIIAPSNAVAESLRAQGLFPSQKIVTIRYGLDTERFPPQLASNRDHICVGSIGNLDPVKGFDVLIRAAAIVTKEIPDAKFSIVGEDRSRDGRNKSELLKLIDELNLENTVDLAGWSDDVGQTLSGFDIFVSASRSESFGFVIAEAMLSGVPVIATETEGAKEIISEATLGRLVPIGSAEQIANAIVDLSSHPAYREQLVQSGRDHVRENFSLKRMVDETEDLYERAISN